MLDLVEWHFLETFVRKRRSIVSADVKVCFESKMSAPSAKALLRVSGAPKALQSKYLKSFSASNQRNFNLLRVCESYHFDYRVLF